MHGQKIYHLLLLGCYYSKSIVIRILTKTFLLIALEYLSIMNIFQNKNQSMWFKNTNMVMRIKGLYILNLFSSSNI